MSENTKIEWATHSFNPWTGCTKVSPGCAHCYAEVDYSVKMRGIKWGPNGTRVVASEGYWKQPLAWNRKAAAEGVRRRVFCASLADVFEDWQGPMRLAASKERFDTDLTICHGCGAWGSTLENCGGNDPKCSRVPRSATMADVRARLFRLIDQTPNLDWLLLTKRPENLARMMPPPPFDHDGWNGTLAGYWHQKGEPRPNVWLGVSVEDQQRADERIPLLLQTPAAVRFLSCEPLLGPVRLRNVPGLNKLPSVHMAEGRSPAGVDWVIIGGESGPHARPLNLEWARSLVEQCKAAGVAVFVKQLGPEPFTELIDLNNPGYRGSMSSKLADRKGGNPEEWPAELRVREFPDDVARALGE